MKKLTIVFLILMGPASFGQQNRAAQTPQAGEPDVVVDIPGVVVDEILLEVENVEAHVSLDARVGNLVRLDAGADVSINQVRLEITGVEAEVYLVVRLDRVAEIIERTLDTIDSNPEVLGRVLDTVDDTVGMVGETANTALQPGGAVSQTLQAVETTVQNLTAENGLLDRTVNQLGQTMVRTIDSAGSIVETTVDRTGAIVGQTAGTSVSQLQGARDVGRQGRSTVRRVTDASGTVIEYVVDWRGRVRDARVVEAPRRR
ncbi:MAG: hypothetical protein KY459_00600 [Acidobacteria bacterium]|nr:hypothetical protein [Acidobacteriota bacterium]